METRRIEKPQAERIYLYDNLKLIAIILVVIGHAIDFLAKTESGNWLEKSLFVAIYSFHMPLFIFISGLFVKPMDKQTKFPKQKVISYFAIAIVLRAFTSIVRLLLGEKERYSILNMYDSYTWFMGAMAVFIALAWLFREYDKKIIFSIAALVGCMAGYDKFLGDKYSLMRIAVFFPIFLLGYYMKPDRLLSLISKRYLKIIAAVVLVGFLAVCLFSRGFTLTLRPLFTGRNRFTVLGDNYAFGAIYRLFCYIVSIVVGLAVMCLVPNKNFGYISKMGAKTLQIYFWHKMILIVFEHFHLYAKIEHFTGSTIATAIYILIAIGVAVLCSLDIFAFPTKQLLSIGKSTAN